MQFINTRCSECLKLVCSQRRCHGLPTASPVHVDGEDFSQTKRAQNTVDDINDLRCTHIKGRENQDQYMLWHLEQCHLSVFKTKSIYFYWALTKYSYSLLAAMMMCVTYFTFSVLCIEQAGRYKATVNKSKPLTYEMSILPHDIAYKKGFNSFNTGQLEDTFLMKEEIGQDLPHKLLIEDMFIRKFMNGVFPSLILSEVIIKRQYNLIRIAAILDRFETPRKIYFLIGFSEELLSYWLKCPVKLELQTTQSSKDVVHKYI